MDSVRHSAFLESTDAVLNLVFDRIILLESGKLVHRPGKRAHFGPRNHLQRLRADLSLQKVLLLLALHHHPGDGRPVLFGFLNQLEDVVALVDVD